VYFEVLLLNVKKSCSNVQLDELKELPKREFFFCVDRDRIRA